MKALKLLFFSTILLVSGCVVAQAQPRYVVPLPPGPPPGVEVGPVCEYPGQWQWDGMRWVCVMPALPMTPPIWWGPPLDYSYPGSGGIFFHFGGGGHHDRGDRGHGHH